MAERRTDLIEAYRHPYLRWLPVAWARERVAQYLGASVGLAAATAAWDLGGEAPLPVVTLVVLLAALTLLWAAVVTLRAALAIRDRTLHWRPDRSELGAVRRRRPHAAEAAHDVAHDEYAVTVGEAGALVTWRFRPLLPEEDPVGAELLIRGVPRYAAAQMEVETFDALDAGRAAEQLAVVQQHAAELELAAADRARREIEEAERARELAHETASTARALRGITGQSGE